MGKTKNGIQVKFCGMNSSEVTGSCIWIKTASKQILLELGLYQSCGSTLEQYKINNRKFEFKAKDIDYVFVMHTHGDHLNLCPLLYKRGGNAKIIAPFNTKKLASILLLDSANIMQRDAEEMSIRFDRDYSPIYGYSDVEKCLNSYFEYPIDKVIQLDENIKFKFTPSGHILNSAQLELWITEGNLTKKIVYTSDLGNTHIKKYYTNKFKPILKGDLFIGESTYSQSKKIANNKVRVKDLEKMKTSIIQTCIEEKGRVLIPVFAQDRTQNMLTHLYDLFGEDESFNIPILVDSPMAVKMCQVYEELLKDEELEKWKKVLSWENVHFVEDYLISREWREKEQPLIVLSSSGMLIPKGRSIAWAHSLLPHSKDRIIFCGYSTEGSIASIIKEGKQKTITISGDKVKNKCQVTNLHSFSSHMQYDSLLSYYGKVDCQKLVLVHGDMDSKTEFGKILQEKISENNLTSRVVVANKDTSLIL